MRPVLARLGRGPTRLDVLLCLLGTACDSATPRRASDEPPTHVASAEPSPQIFGTPANLPGAPLDVEQVLAAPASYLKQVIKCRGTVARVCEAAGCWLELRPDSGGEGLRVPMAGHSFVVPQSIVGKTAVVEGTLSARELSDAELAHLRGEGLKAAGPLFLAATSVTVASEPARSR
jgi:hypothetical protein